MSEHVLDHLSAYLDGELSDAERERFRAHLASCSECAARLTELAAVDETVRRDPQATPDGYFDELPARIRARALKATPARTLTRFPPWALAAAAVLLVGVLAPLALRERPVPASQEDRVAAVPAQRKAPPLTVAPRTPVPPAALGKLDDKLSSKKALAKDARADAPPPQAGGAPAAPPPAAPPAARGFAEAPAAAPAAANEAPRLLAQEQQPPQPERQKDELAVAGPMKQQQNAAAGVRDEQRLGAKTADLDRARRVQPEEAKNAAASTPDLCEGTPKTAAAARALRERCRRFALESSDAALADNARVRVIELGLLAWRMEADAGDLEQARLDALAYLRRPDAAQAAKVRPLLDSIGK